MQNWSNIGCKSTVKGLVLCAINAKSLTAAYLAFRGEQESRSNEKSLKKSEALQLLDAFIKQNPVVENYIGQDKGVELMNLDGEITAKIINHFTAKSIPILTVHDSYIVQEGKDIELIQVMNDAVGKVLGNYNIRVTQDVPSQYMLHSFAAQDSMDRYHHLQNMKNIPKPKRCSGYIKRRDNFKNWRNQL
jgi:hypothetical protein